MLGTGPRAARARPQSVRRPQPLAEPNPMRAANPRRAARSRSRVLTPPPIASHPRVAPLDRASQVAVPVSPACGLSALAMVRGLVPSVNQGQLDPLPASAEECRYPSGILDLVQCVLPFASPRPPFALLAGVAVPDALAPTCACVAAHRNRHRQPRTHPAT